MHDRVVFEPVSRNDMTEQEKKRAMKSLIFLVQKRSGKMKLGAEKRTISRSFVMKAMFLTKR